MRALAPVEPALSAALRGHLARWLGPVRKGFAREKCLLSKPQKNLRRTGRMPVLLEAVAMRFPIIRTFSNRVWLGGRPRLQTIAAFAALPDEPDLLPLLATLPGCRWVLPRVAGPAEIELHLVTGPGDLASGAFGIPEPDTAAPKVLPGEIDVFLCPGLAFDSAGRRLGRGRGYYDRLLAAARPDAELVGIAPSGRIVAAVPALPHDIRMGWLASENGVEECVGGRSAFAPG